jgi:hypothetical protein
MNNPSTLLLLVLTMGAARAQEIKHEDNEDGLKLSIDGPGIKGTASAGGPDGGRATLLPSGFPQGSSGSASASSSSSTSTSTSGTTSGPQVGDYLRSVPEPGTSASHKESTVSLMHNGKSVKVTRRPSRYGGEEVIVTTNDGGKEKVEEMTLAQYEHRYLGKKRARSKDRDKAKEGDETRGAARKGEDKAAESTGAGARSGGSASASGEASAGSSAKGEAKGSGRSDGTADGASDGEGPPLPGLDPADLKPGALPALPGLPKLPLTPNRATE